GVEHRDKSATARTIDTAKRYRPRKVGIFMLIGLSSSARIAWQPLGPGGRTTILHPEPVKYQRSFLRCRLAPDHTPWWNDFERRQTAVSRDGSPALDCSAS